MKRKGLPLCWGFFNLLFGMMIAFGLISIWVSYNNQQKANQIMGLENTNAKLGAIIAEQGNYINYLQSIPPPEPEIITMVLYRFPNTKPYTVFADPIDFEQARLLLEGMRASHVQALGWTFSTDPGFGIADREFQQQCIKWYDQLIDYVYRTEGIK